MFRPARESTFFRLFPFRLIVSVLLILALVVSVLLVFSLEHEKFVVSGLTEGKADPLKLFPALWQSRRDLIAITVMLFLLSAVAIAAVVTYLHYDSTRRTLEEVKGLARNILQSIPTGVLTVNSNGLVTAVNPAAEKVLQRSSSALLGHTYTAVFSEGDTVREVLDRALHRHGYVQNQDLLYQDRDYRTRTIRVSTAELVGDDGQRGGVILQAQDITERVALEQRVRVAEKLAALHTLSAGVAHELRNPLSAVDLNLQLLEEELSEGSTLSPKTRQYLQVLNVESRRLSGILDNFLKFSRPGAIPLHEHEIDVKDLIAHIAALLQYEAEDRNIRLETRVAEGLPRLVGDETQIGQVLVNVVVNAFHAMPTGGLCRISAIERESNGQPMLEIAVHDTGIGIKSEDLGRIFEPFFTTKATGSGLGLAIAYRIVEDHGGAIKVESTPGMGTTLTIRLPAASLLPPEQPVKTAKSVEKVGP